MARLKSCPDTRQITTQVGALNLTPLRGLGRFRLRSQDGASLVLGYSLALPPGAWVYRSTAGIVSFSRDRGER